MILYQISLPKAKDADAFKRFLKDDYIPAVHKGATRVGKVTSLSLLQNDEGHDFYLQVGWDGLRDRDLRIDNEETLKKLAGFNAKFKRLGEFDELASWKEDVEQ